MTAMPRRRSRGPGGFGIDFLAVLALAVVAPATLPWSPAAADASALEVRAGVDGKPAAGSSDSHPVRLDPTKPVRLDLQVTNGGPRPLEVRTVRVEGRVAGLAFFAYDTSVRIRSDPGTTERRGYLLDMAGLDGQATGLIPTSISVLDADRNVLASQRFVADVRGSLRSVYGLFGLAVAGLTALSFTAVLLALARQRLPPNRWRRAVRFLTPGLGLGLLTVFTLSATRVFAPRPARWVSIVTLSALVLFVLGYLTPSVEDHEGDEDVEAIHDSSAPSEAGGRGRAATTVTT